MSQSFRTFRDILGKAKPQQLKELLNRIVEVVEWHEDENDRASGHCLISYFEQPNLQLPIKKLSEPDGELRFAESMVWLPERNPLHNILQLAGKRQPIGISKLLKSQTDSVQRKGCKYDFPINLHPLSRADNPEVYSPTITFFLSY